MGFIRSFIRNMSFFYRLTLAVSVVSLAVAQISDSTFNKHPNALKIPSSFDPIIPAYWTGLPHHRRTPFAVSFRSAAILSRPYLTAKDLPGWHHGIFGIPRHNIRFSRHSASRSRNLRS